MSTMYARGADFERLVKKSYEEQGYLVIRSAGSHSPVDLVAMQKGLTVLIQCKLSGVLTKDDRAALKKVRAKTNYPTVLAYKNGQGIVLKELRV